jgi:hypothetical protein
MMRQLTSCLSAGRLLQTAKTKCYPQPRGNSPQVPVPEFSRARPSATKLYAIGLDKASPMGSAVPVGL